MKWDIDKDKPVCPQIYMMICSQIANGVLKPNQKLLSVRKLSYKLDVNPNTIKKTFKLLAEKGVLYSVKNNGWFVSDNSNVLKENIDRQIREVTRNFMYEMNQLGLSKNKILEIIREYTS